MAKANGYSASGDESQVCVAANHSKYTRTTELRRVEDNDIYRLSTYLNENAGWRKLMSIIPKRLDAQTCSRAGALNNQEIVANVGLKYTVQHISQIDGAAERLPHKSVSQLMIDEWKTSGKLNERPTVGVLLQLLVYAELFSAADFVALEFLNEPKPERPDDGPAAIISLDDSCEYMEVDNEGANYQPNTAALNAAAAQAGGSVGMNMDLFEKHMVPRDKSVPQQMPQNGIAVPIPPPRAGTRKLEATAINATPTTVSVASSIPNVPILSILNPTSSELITDVEAYHQLQQHKPQHEEQSMPHTVQNVPNLSILNASSENDSSMLQDGNTTAATAAVTSTSKANVPLITLLIENSSSKISASAATEATTTKSTTTAAISYNNLPKISALNLNADSGHVLAAAHDNGSVSHDDGRSSSTSSISNDDDDDDDDDDEGADISLPNLSNSEHQNSNNDSSLTTVTGTSGENSFDLTNDSSSASNDDSTNNIPNLSELQLRK